MRLALFCFAKGYERLGHYLFKAVLILFLTATLQDNDKAIYLAGLYLGSLYLTPVLFGALVSWKPSWQVGAVFLGCGFLALGYCLLATGISVTLAIVVLAIGNGLFSTNQKAVFSRVLAPEGQSLDAEFTWLYTATNLGSFVAPHVAIALNSSFELIFLVSSLCALLSAFFCWIAIPRSLPSQLRQQDGLGTHNSALRTIVVLFVITLSIVFWIGFEQKGIKLMQFANIMATEAKWSVPAISLLSINPFVVLLLTPLFAILWRFLARGGRDPHPLNKMSLGLILLGLGYIELECGIRLNGSAPIGIRWFIGLYVLHSLGEILLEPIGQDFVTRNTSIRFRPFFLAIWESTSGVAVLSGSVIAVSLGNQLWLTLGMGACLSGLILMAFTPFLRKAVC
jgi:proton-dependent oligopeptide transporter, POT family